MISVIYSYKIYSIEKKSVFKQHRDQVTEKGILKNV